MSLFERWFSGGKNGRNWFSGRDFLYGMHARNTDESRLEMVSPHVRMLGKYAMRTEASQETTLNTNAIDPTTQRLHVAELRPLVFTAAQKILQAEHIARPERQAASDMLMATFPVMAAHQSAGGTHMSFTELVNGAEAQGSTLKAFTDAYERANSPQ